MAGRLTARLIHRRTVAQDVSDLCFNLVDPAQMPFKGGQFVTLSVGKDEAGQQLRRSYSIASFSDKADHLRFLIKLIPGGVASDFFLHLPEGAQIDLTGPHGFFVLDERHHGDVVFAATGTGLAPVLPMLRELAARQETGRRIVYWGLRNESDLFLVDEVRALCEQAGADLHIYLSRPDSGWTGHRGRITDPILESLARLQKPTFYLVGNGAMISELKKGLMALGVNRKQQIRTEAFFD